jgi:ferredoxin-NADP reductase
MEEYYVKIRPIKGMEEHFVKIRSIMHVTYNVLKIVTDRPDDYEFNPGQATKISINKAGWEDEKRPFTFTSIPEDRYLEFTIKIYPEREGVTNKLMQLKVNDELILHKVFGSIAYKNEGIFIAGGAGITPFISIFRQLHADDRIGNNKLIFANKTKSDIILEPQLEGILGRNFIRVLSDEVIEGYEHGFVTSSLIKKYIDSNYNTFYVCGPPPMMDAVGKILHDLHVDPKMIIKETF